MMDRIPHPLHIYSYIAQFELNEKSLDDVDIKVINEYEKQDKYNCAVYHVRLVSISDNSKYVPLVLKVIPKFRSELEVEFPVQEYFDREIYMYKYVFPLFEEIQKMYRVPIEDTFLIIKHYKSDDKIILMEDLYENGFVFKTNRRYFDNEHLKIVLKGLAQLHAQSFAMKKLDTREFNELVENMTLIKPKTSFCKKIERDTVKIARHFSEFNVKKSIAKFCGSLTKILYEACDAAKSSPYNVICHTDCWSGNILFKYENGKPVDMKLIDWQTAKYCSPIIDLQYAIMINTGISMHDDCYKELLDFYYEKLTYYLKNFKCDIKECFPRYAFDIHIMEFSVFTLCKMIMLLPIVEGVDMVVDRNHIFEILEKENLKLRIIETALDMMDLDILQKFIPKNES